MRDRRMEMLLLLAAAGDLKQPEEILDRVQAATDRGEISPFVSEVLRLLDEADAMRGNAWVLVEPSKRLDLLANLIGETAREALIHLAATEDREEVTPVVERLLRHLADAYLALLELDEHRAIESVPEDEDEGHPT